MRTSAAVTSYAYDRLGRPTATRSVRAVVKADGEILQQNDYQPYGEIIPDSDHFSGENDYLYCGKEFQSFFDLPFYDSGARFQRNDGIFLSVDPLAEKYYGISPYAYCSGNPINRVDPEGCKILFVNGLDKFGAKKAGPDYWGGSSSRFVKKAMSSLKDNSIGFIPVKHKILSSAKGRKRLGYEYAKQNYFALISDLKEGESIKFISHSMGSAFAEGMAEFLISQNTDVSTLIHFEPYQAAEIKSVGENTNVLVIDVQTEGDWVIDMVGEGEIEAADIHHKITPENNPGWQYIHTYALKEETWDEILALINKFLSSE